MRYLRLASWTFVVALITGGASAAPAETPVLTELTEALAKARYMSPAGGCAPSPIDLHGWPKAELERCVYTVTDRPSGTVKRGVVYLANPSPEIILAWFRSACRTVGQAATDACVRAAIPSLIEAGGGQFPVGGVVWEDKVEDGVYEAYAFRNGVTVRLEGLLNGSLSPLSDSLLETLAVSADYRDGFEETGGAYARVWSTSREHYIAFTGRNDLQIEGASIEAARRWSSMVGALHRRALAEDQNPLITARMCAGYGYPKGCRP